MIKDEIKDEIIIREINNCKDGCKYLMSIYQLIDKEMEYKYEEVKDVTSCILKNIRSILGKSVLLEDTYKFLNKNIDIENDNK